MVTRAECNDTLGYPIVTGRIEAVDQALGDRLRDRDYFLVTDSHVVAYWAEPLLAKIPGNCLGTWSLEAGEANKTVANYCALLDQMAQSGCHRDTVIVALGGGVVGDLAGFAAATYHRGVPLVQVPTSLLAQVDAAIGGKTGVNHALGKNAIGAFYSPVGVYMAPERLATLPGREYRAGMGEIVKYGLGFDAEYLEWIESHVPQLNARELDTVLKAVRRASRIKAEVVAKDFHEEGLRATLNLGHTLGHALETALGYGFFLHGEAVGIGLRAAVRLSIARGYIPQVWDERLVRLLERFALPVRVPTSVNFDAVRKALRMDKKILDHRLRFVGLQEVGRATIWQDVACDEIVAIARELVGPESRANIDVP